MKQPNTSLKPHPKLSWQQLLGSLFVASSVIALALCHSTPLMVLLAAISVFAYTHLVAAKPHQTPES